MSLREELDTATLLRVQQKLKPNKQRALRRMKVQASAFLRTGGRVLRATVRDISSLGTRMSTDAKLQVGDRTLVEFTDLPAIGAYVRWSDGGEVGLIHQPCMLPSAQVTARFHSTGEQPIVAPKTPPFHPLGY